MSQDMCPICAKEFQNNDVVVKYMRWGDEVEYVAHVDCLLYSSETEKRKHPPLEQVLRPQPKRSRTTKARSRSSKSAAT
jgi:hypothetical protein